MNELLSLKPMQMDALREVANIGAGHAATALSQMTVAAHHDQRAAHQRHAARGRAAAYRHARGTGGRGADEHARRPDGAHVAGLPAQHGDARRRDDAAPARWQLQGPR